MTDEIDIDALDVGDDDEEQTERVGDPIWYDDDDDADGSPATEPTDDQRRDEATEPTDGQRAASAPDADLDSTSDPDSDAASGDEPSNRIPHVPHADKGKPAGIPTESGGSGGGAGQRQRDGAAADPPEDDETEPTGPHGETADDLTLAFTYRAVKRVADPAYVFSDAATWSDWLGIVGDVPASAINKFQREHALDVDFFTGAATGPRERLANIDEYSMFHAERFVLVGCQDDDVDESEWAPEGWEFLPIETAAEEAGWSRR